MREYESVVTVVTAFIFCKTETRENKHVAFMKILRTE
jgi:hypothetical protein